MLLDINNGTGVWVCCDNASVTLVNGELHLFTTKIDLENSGVEVKNEDGSREWIYGDLTFLVNLLQLSPIRFIPKSELANLFRTRNGGREYGALREFSLVRHLF